MNWKKKRFLTPKPKITTTSDFNPQDAFNEALKNNRVHEEYGPGSFATHEALTIIRLLTRAFEHELIEHRAIQSNPAWLMQSRKTYNAMLKLHRMIQEWRP